MRFFSSYLVELHTNIFILEKVLTFPLRLFAGPEQIFFRQVIINIYDPSILIITRIIADQEGDLFTLSRFKNAVFQNTKETYREPLQQRLKAVRFDQETLKLLARAKTIRNQCIAHITRESRYLGHFCAGRLQQGERIDEWKNDCFLLMYQVYLDHFEGSKDGKTVV